MAQDSVHGNHSGPSYQAVLPASSPVSQFLLWFLLQFVHPTDTRACLEKSITPHQMWTLHTSLQRLPITSRMKSFTPAAISTSSLHSCHTPAQWLLCTRGGPARPGLAKTSWCHHGRSHIAGTHLVSGKPGWLVLRLAGELI